MASRDLLRALAAILSVTGAGFGSVADRRERERERALREAADRRSEEFLKLAQSNQAFQQGQAGIAEERRVRDEANRANDPFVAQADRLAALLEPLQRTDSRPIAVQGQKGVAAETIPLTTEGGAITPGSRAFDAIGRLLRSGGDVGGIDALVARAGAVGPTERMVQEAERSQKLTDIGAETEARERAQQPFQEELIRLSAGLNRAGGGGGLTPLQERGLVTDDAQGTAEIMAAQGKNIQEIAGQLIVQFPALRPGERFGIATRAVQKAVQAEAGSSVTGSARDAEFRLGLVGPEVKARRDDWDNAAAELKNRDPKADPRKVLGPRP